MSYEWDAPRDVERRATKVLCKIMTKRARLLCVYRPIALLVRE